MSTAAVSKMVADVARRFPEITDVQIDSCRKIADSNTWSQHAFDNAADWMVGTNKSLGNRLYYYLLANKVRLSIGTICWLGFGGCNEADHQDHVHAEGYPKQTGTPSCAGGSSGVSQMSTGNESADAGGFDLLGIGDLFNGVFALRILWFLGGSFMVGYGMVALLKEFGVDVVGTAKGVTGLASKVVTKGVV